jgi:hypothetical protein
VKTTKEKELRYDISFLALRRGKKNVLELQDGD